MDSLTSQLSFLTADLPGTGGTLKARPEDFLVEEQPASELTGEGEHLYIFIEKRRRTTIEVVRRLAKAFGVSRGEIGYAGMKDKHAITRQAFSIRLPDRDMDEKGLAKLEHHPQLTVLWAQRHEAKLRRGHHGGNRFVIRLRDVDATAALRAKAVLDRLTAMGVPNFIGEQRFGIRQNGHRLGRCLLMGDYQTMLDDMLGGSADADSKRLCTARQAYEAGDYMKAIEHWPKQLHFDRQALDALRQGRDARGAVMAIDRGQRDFLVSAFQSAVFNVVLNRRIAEGLFDKLIEGDLAWKHENGAVFAVDGPTAELENSEAGRMPVLAISPSGPMWGVKMIKPKGYVLEMEQAALAEMGIGEQQLAGVDRHEAEGRRRPLRVPLRDADVSGGVDEHGSFVRLAFELPRGAYATVVLREVMKEGRGR